MAALQIGKHWLVPQHDARSHRGGEHHDDRNDDDHHHDDDDDDGYDDADQDHKDEEGHDDGDVSEQQTCCLQNVLFQNIYSSIRLNVAWIWQE